MHKSFFNASGNYVSPVCDVHFLEMTSIICDSPAFGGENEAGKEMGDDDNYTYNY